MTDQSAKPSYSQRTTIVLSPEVDEILEPRSGIVGRSGAVRSIIQRYAAICARAKPNLSEAEWNLLRDSLNGVWHQDHPWSIGWLAAGVEDSIRLDKLDEKWSVDGPSLLAKLRALSYAELVALVDSVEVWWSSED